MFQNTIAIIYDCDLTLIPEYIQGPIFRRWDIDPTEFWAENKRLLERVAATRNSPGAECLAHKDVAYLHLLAQKAQPEGPLDGLTRLVLRELGKEVEFFPGVPKFFDLTRKVIEEDPKYKALGITVEHYVESTGLYQMIMGSKIAPHINGVEACDFFYEEDPNGPQGNMDGRPLGPSMPVTFTEKTGFVFRLNKGTTLNPAIGVNDKVDHCVRRIPMRNMIYVGDGPTDVPPMALIRKNGGKAIAVYDPKTKLHRLQRNPAENAYGLRRDGRVDNMCIADYRKGKGMYWATVSMLQEIADRIVLDHDRKVMDAVGSAPDHMT